MAARTDRRSAAAPTAREVAARRAAALAEIRLWGDPVLRTPAREVERFDGALGAGLAANQVGLLQRLLVYRVEPGAPLRVLVNPEVEWVSADVEPFSEGGLSLPGVWVQVRRPSRVRVARGDAHA